MAFKRVCGKSVWPDRSLADDLDVEVVNLPHSRTIRAPCPSVSQSAVMEEVFLWLQRTMLSMVDDEEEVFVDLGRKLLTVHKYVVANATTDADLSRTFWAEATALTKHGLAAAERMDLQEGAVPGTGVGGSGDPREDSVLLALPGFRFKVRFRRLLLRVRMSRDARHHLSLSRLT